MYLMHMSSDSPKITHRFLLFISQAEQISIDHLNLGNGTPRTTQKLPSLA